MRELLAMLDAAYDRPSWHGTNLRGSIRGVPPEMAAWRPGRRRHNIWELVVHAAYWKYIGLRRLTGAARGSFPLKGSNWFTRPESWTLPAPGARTSRCSTHRTARCGKCRGQAPGRGDTLPCRAAARRHAVGLLSGIAAHDLYHAGQIQLLKRLYRDRHAAAGRRTSGART
jgi:hypothetical protein